MIWYIKDNGLDVVAEPPRINLPPPPLGSHYGIYSCWNEEK